MTKEINYLNQENTDLYPISQIDIRDGDTLVYLDNGSSRTIKELYEETQQEPNKTYGVYAVNKSGELVRTEMGQYAYEVYHITLSNGDTLTGTGNHPFLTYDREWVKAENLEEKTTLFRAELLDSEVVEDDRELTVTSIKIDNVEQQP